MQPLLVFALNKIGRRTLIGACEIFGGAACLLSMIVYEFSTNQGDGETCNETCIKFKNASR